MEISEISRLAQEAGMSYGRYVFLHSSELGGAGGRHRLHPGEHRCEWCGRVFSPVNRRNRFCRDACRIAWNTNKRKQIKKPGGDGCGEVGTGAA